jgi:hypothetical protein
MQRNIAVLVNGKSRVGPRISVDRIGGMGSTELVPVAARIRGTNLSTAREQQFDGGRAVKPLFAENGRDGANKTR